MNFSECTKMYEKGIGKECNVDVINVDSIFEKSIELGDESATKDFDDLNGRVILPINVDEKYIILLNNKLFSDGSINFIKTIFHEMTHVCDYMDLFSFLNIVNTKDAESYEYIWCIKLWMEFHANLIGHSMFRSLKLGDKILDSQIKTFHIEHELPDELKYTEEMCKRNISNLANQLYYLFLFFGKLSVWSNLYPEFYSEETIKQALGYDKKIIELYCFCINHKEFASAINSIDKMERIIMQ